MNLKENYVITISREVGSGGHSVAIALAEKLGVPCYDKYLINSLVEKFNLDAGTIERIKGQKKNWFDDFFAFASPAPRPDMFVAYQPMSYTASSDEIIRCEKEILSELPKKGSCVIAGRSAFFQIKDHPNKLDIFIRASQQTRLRHIMDKQNLSEEEAAKVMEVVDKGRENFVQRCTGKSRYDLRNYHLMLNMDELTVEQAVQVVLDYIGGQA
ncbi:MAG: cytidylate kinase-like family protein [Bacteroidales bacterium]|nr:cytidylate kinase-like family protein [Bacteroidales bacterium]